MTELPPIAPDPVQIPGQDSPGLLPGTDAPEPSAPPEFIPDGGPMEMPDTTPYA